MKKRFSSTDINQKHGNEVSKKLYRTITDQTKRLDDARSCARSISDLFTPNLLIQRRKLCEYCERLIFSDPALFGKKGEELLWRKVFYDTVSAAKKLKKNFYTQDEVCNLQNHIYAGVGFYHHFLSKLQTTFNLKLPNAIDFPMNESDIVVNEDLKEYHQEWAEMAVHQCLIYLGDLNRYKLEITSNSDTSLPIRFYMQAIFYKPDYGMPHNQMGTLALSQENHLDAVYHYMRCLACKYSFDGTSNNLISLFEKNSHYLEQLPHQNNDPDCKNLLPKSDHVKRFIARFLLLIDIWYFNKNISKVFNLCHSTFKDLDDCLSYSKESSENGETDADSSESESTNTPTYLSSGILFKITVICLLCMSKLQSSNSQQLSTVTAFTLAVYSQLIQKITNHIQVSVLNYPLTEIDVDKKQKKKISAKALRRRRTLKKGANEDSESSDDDLSVYSSDGSFISDQEDILVQSSEDELDASLDTTNPESVDKNTQSIEETDKTSADLKQKQEVLKKIQKMDVNDMIEIISEENLLQSIKILNDWLTMDSAILESCCVNTRSLIRQITYLLNLVNFEISEKHFKSADINLSYLKGKEKIPLTEDVVLKGWNFLSDYQKDLDWNRLSNKTVKAKEEAILRIIKLKEFGKHLMGIPEAGITFDNKLKIYICKQEENEKLTKDQQENSQDFSLTMDAPPLINGKTREDSSPSPNNSRGCQMIKMKHMGQLWLASEVSALENRVRGRTSLSPYLVIDADSLTKYTFMVKYLVQSRKFIVLVPTAVVSALDDLKREKPEARDAIRWLETQFQRGNRFFRSQRPQEKASIPFIKYPKKKDKEMMNYIQIIECCYYLSEQQKGATNVVTLLIGNQNLLTNGENKEFSYVGLAKTAGITIESITQFYNKWKKCNRDNR